MNNNIGYFEALWMFVWNMIRNSGIYKLLRSIYDGISGAWRSSRITGWFRKIHISARAIPESLAGRVVRWPFTLLEWMGKRWGEALNRGIAGSRLIELGRVYLHNCLALNLRFLGVVLLCADLGLAGSSFVLGRTPGILHAVLLVVSGLMVMADVNVTGWLQGSGLVRMAAACLGIDFSFDFYDKNRTAGSKRLWVGGVLGLLCGLAGGVTSPLYGAAALVGMAALFLTLYKVEAGVFFLIFLAPLAPTMAMVGLALLCVVSLVIRGITTPNFRWKFDGIGFLMLVFMGIYLVAGLTSFARLKSLSIWGIYAVFMACYFVIINTIRTRKQLLNLISVFVLSGLAVCAYGIAQYVFGWDTAQAWMDEEMFTDIKMRIYSTLGNPNVLGEYILLVLPACAGLMWIKKKPLQRLVYGALAALMFVALILTFSRGCWIGIMAAAVIFITFVAGKLWGLGLVALPLAAAVLPESIVNRFASIGDMKDSSTSYRVYIWMGTLAMIRDFWISGIGMGSEAFTEVYPFYSYNAVVAPHSHNLFLQILVESGVTGIVVFLLILMLLLRRLMTGYQIGGRGDALSTMMVALGAGICGFLLQGMFDNCFYNYRVMLIFWCVAALARVCVSVAQQDRDNQKDKEGGIS